MNDNIRKLDKEIKKIFHTYTTKSLFLCKRERPDIETTVTFLTTRVIEPDKNNWKKLYIILTYLKYTNKLVLILERDNLNILKWFIDVSYAVHKDIKNHTGGGLTIEKSAVFSKSIKQKLNTKSSAETEIVGIDNILSQVL